MARTHVNPSRAEPRRRLVALQMLDWSEWPRQIVRGVQRFAHERPEWRIYFAAGDLGDEQVLSHWERFDGIITASLNDVRAWRRVLKQGSTKVVAVTSQLPASFTTMPCVRVNDETVAASIGRHLLAGGFRRFAFAFGAGPKPGWRNARYESLAAFARAEGCPCEVIPYPPRLAFKARVRSVAKAISKMAKPMGIVAWNLNVARLAVEACQWAKITVPAEVAVVSWDDDPIVAETLEPTVSAAVLPAERVGLEAARLLNHLMSQPSMVAPRPMLVEPSGLLHIRQSSDVSALEDRDIYLALQYIRERATETLKIENIAKALHVSRRTLERNFKRTTHRTILDAIVDVRLERAKQLLLETDWSTDRVAERSGMGTEPNLRQAFIRREGLTPGVYRGRYGQAPQPKPGDSQI